MSALNWRPCHRNPFILKNVLCLPFSVTTMYSLQKIIFITVYRTSTLVRRSKCYMITAWWKFTVTMNVLHCTSANHRAKHIQHWVNICHPTTSVCIKSRAGIKKICWRRHPGWEHPCYRQLPWCWKTVFTSNRITKLVLACWCWKRSIAPSAWKPPAAVHCLDQELTTPW